MKMSFQPRSIIKGSLFLFLFLGVISFLGSNVNAAAPFAPTRAIGDTGPVTGGGIFNNPSNPRTLYYTVGQGQYDYGSQEFTVYVPEGTGNFIVDLENAGYDCVQVSSGAVVGPDFGGAETAFNLVGRGGNFQIPAKIGSAGCSPVRLTWQDQYGTSVPSGTPGQSYRKFLIHAQLTPAAAAAGGDKENAFRVTSPTAGVIFGLDGYNTNGLGYRQENLTLGNKWGAAVVFGTDPTACGKRDANVSWKDADPERDDWSNNMVFAIYYQPRYADPTNPGQWTLDPNTDLHQAQNQILDNYSYQSRPNSGYEIDPDYRYMLVMQNIGVRNTVQVRISGPEVSQYGGARSDKSPYCETQQTDLCLNLDKIQTTVPAGYQKDTPGNQPGTCFRPPSGSPTFEGYCSFLIAKNSFVQGEGANYDVYTHNTGSAEWRDTRGTPNQGDDISNVYISTNGSPPPGSHLIFSDPATTRLPTILPPGYSPPGVSTNNTFPVDTSTAGNHSVTYYIYRVRSSPIYFDTLGSCTLDYRVTDPVPNGEINANCSQINGRLFFEGPAYGRPVDGYVKYVDPSTYTEVARDTLSAVANEYFVRPTYISSSSGLKPYSNYYVELWAVVNGRDILIIDSNVSDQYTGSNCMSATCSINPSGALRYRTDTDFTITSNVANNTLLTYPMYIVSTPRGSLYNTDGTQSPRASNTVGVGNSSPGITIDPHPIMYSTGDGGISVGVYIDYGYGPVNMVPNELNGPNCDGTTQTSLRYPYVRTYSGDTIAGGGFESSGSCNPKAAGIFAHMETLQNQSRGYVPSLRNAGRGGSGSQLGSFGFSGGIPNNDAGKISGFTSATLRPNPIPPPIALSGNGLTFGGEASVNTGSDTALVGGNLDGNAPCITDYYYSTQYPVGSPKREDSPSPANQISANANYTDKQVFYANSIASIAPSIQNFNRRTTYYVNGDVFIDKDITYKDRYANLDDIPNFTLVVLGNIYISRDVTRLDGNYIAQPKNSNGGSGNGGYIYTCSLGLGNVPTLPGNLYSSCYGEPNTGVKQLVVNGSFTAKKVVLNRAVNNLDDSKYLEPASTSKAAEVFNFSPEVFLIPPVFKPISTLTSGDYESMALLPPIF